MKDRQSSYPGRYKGSITASEFAKLQAGEQFVITLTRNDQPTVPGTPYNKDSVLPDSVAAVICPDIGDPTPADAFAGLLPTNGKKPMAANLDMGSFKVKNVGDPVDYYDAAHKRYVDRIAFHENFLDNSDFSNPVNQRGKTSYATINEFTIDRWYNFSGITVKIDGGCLELTNSGTATRYIQQTIPRNLNGKYLWLAVCLEDGTVYVVMGNVRGDGSTGSITSGTRGDLSLSLRKTDDEYVQVRIGLQAGDSARIKWAMLYEGETLPGTTTITGDMSAYVPDYQPKGYFAELMECMRYYQIMSTNNVAAVDLRPPMISEPEISSVSGGYAYSAEV